ncbi:MAG: mechanosensitive ion channel family protein [Nitrospiria bacterium]
MIGFLTNTLLQFEIQPETAALFARGLAIALVLLLSITANFLTKRMLLSGLFYLISRSKTQWDDALLKHRVFDHLAHFAPAIVLTLLAPLALEGHSQWITITTNGLNIYMIIVGVLTLNALLNAVTTIYQSLEISKEIPIKAFIQALKIVIYLLALIFLISALLDKTPLYLLSGLGAMTAVFMLIFRDAILGFAAGIQLTANKMVAPGDWIEMPKYGADGDVIEVTLTTVKVQNWDKTIANIPTYSLISESFKNWRGMSESGGRRIKRAIYIDVNTIQFCTEQMIEKFSKIRPITAYISGKIKELERYNTTHRLDDTSIVNRRRLTNIGTFRAYAIAYLKNHPQIHQDMTFLIRQLAPTEHGLPIEIYVFCRDTVWANYEAIQADIFDHLLAAVPEFGLSVFQNPSGNDLGRLAENRAEPLTVPER